MPEAVIVATARSPIGRAGKGSLTSIRPDDMAAQMVRAALAKVPQLDPADVGDLILGCGLPGGEQGFNMARVVAVLLGDDHCFGHGTVLLGIGFFQSSSCPVAGLPAGSDQRQITSVQDPGSL